jgi:hypothetical protein
MGLFTGDFFMVFFTRFHGDIPGNLWDIDTTYDGFLNG